MEAALKFRRPQIVRHCIRDNAAVVRRYVGAPSAAGPGQCTDAETCADAGFAQDDGSCECILGFAGEGRAIDCSRAALRSAPQRS
mgnify:CR=1 FL=1